MQIQHEDDGKRGRFFIKENDEELAEMVYEWYPSHINIEHTEVSDKLKGHGIGGKLVAAAVEWARERHLKISATCTFAKAVFEKKPEYGDVYFH